MSNDCEKLLKFKQYFSVPFLQAYNPVIKKAFCYGNSMYMYMYMNVCVEPPESIPWAAVNAESENTRYSAGNGIRMIDSGQSRK